MNHEMSQAIGEWPFPLTRLVFQNQIIVNLFFHFHLFKMAIACRIPIPSQIKDKHTKSLLFCQNVNKKVRSDLLLIVTRVEQVLAGILKLRKMHERMFVDILQKNDFFKNIMQLHYTNDMRILEMLFESNFNFNEKSDDLLKLNSLMRNIESTKATRNSENYKTIVDSVLSFISNKFPDDSAPKKLQRFLKKFYKRGTFKKHSHKSSSLYELAILSMSQRTLRCRGEHEFSFTSMIHELNQSKDFACALSKFVKQHFGHTEFGRRVITKKNMDTKNLIRYVDEDLLQTDPYRKQLGSFRKRDQDQTDMLMSKDVQEMFHSKSTSHGKIGNITNGCREEVVSEFRSRKNGKDETIQAMKDHSLPIPSLNMSCVHEDNRLRWIQKDCKSNLTDTMTYYDTENMDTYTFLKRILDVGCTPAQVEAENLILNLFLHYASMLDGCIEIAGNATFLDHFKSLIKKRMLHSDSNTGLKFKDFISLKAVKNCECLYNSNNGFISGTYVFECLESKNNKIDLRYTDPNNNEYKSENPSQPYELKKLSITFPLLQWAIRNYHLNFNDDISIGIETMLYNDDLRINDVSTGASVYEKRLNTLAIVSSGIATINK